MGENESGCTTPDADSICAPRGPGGGRSSFKSTGRSFSTSTGSRPN